MLWDVYRGYGILTPGRVGLSRNGGPFWLDDLCVSCVSKWQADGKQKTGGGFPILSNAHVFFLCFNMELPCCRGWLSRHSENDPCRQRVSTRRVTFLGVPFPFFPGIRFFSGNHLKNPSWKQIRFLRKERWLKRMDKESTPRTLELLTAKRTSTACCRHAAGADGQRVLGKGRSSSKIWQWLSKPFWDPIFGGR